VRHPSRTRRFWYYIRVLFIALARVMRMCCHGPTYENPRWRLRPEICETSVRNNIFVNLQRLYLDFRSNTKDVCRTQIKQIRYKQMIYIAVLCNPKITAEPLCNTPCSLDPMPLPTIRRFKITVKKTKWRL